MAERRRERNATLAARCLTACRAAFSADLVFATLEILRRFPLTSGSRSVGSRGLEVNRKPGKNPSSRDCRRPAGASVLVGCRRDELPPVTLRWNRCLMRLLRRLCRGGGDAGYVATIGGFD